MRLRRPPKSENDELSELAGLADGSLPAGRREAVQRRVTEAPELAPLLAEQRRAVSIVRTAAPEIATPQGLLRRIETERAGRGARRLPLVLTTSTATAVAAVVVAVVLSLSGGVTGPSVAQAASLATLPATAPPPAPLPGQPTRLATDVEGVPFPNLSRKFAWQVVGARADSLDGHHALTVFYAESGQRIGYTIVSGKPLGAPKNAVPIARGGTTFRVFRGRGREVVTWLREGHTCVLSGTTAGRGVLIELAAWRGNGTIPF